MAAAARALREFVGGDLAAANDEATNLCAIEDPVETPFKSKYAAINVLCAARKQLAGLLDAHERERASAGSDAAGGDSAAAEDALCALDVRLGGIHIDVEAPHDAQGCLERALAHVTDGGKARVRQRLRATAHDLYNQLGVLWTNRGEHERAGAYLEEAAEIYASFGAFATAASPLEPTRDCEAYAGETAERLYAHTAFYLAQSYGVLGRDEEAAAMCGETLTRQLTAAAAGATVNAAAADYGQQLAGLNFADWVGNTAQLSGAFVGLGDMVAAEHCVLAAEAVWALRPGGASGGESDGVRERELGANIALCRGKLHAARLEKAVQQRQSRQFGRSDDEEEDEARRTGKRRLPLGGVRGITLPEPHLRPVGAITQGGWLDACAEFRDAQRAFRVAMEFYVLDGYVTDHVNVLRALSAAHGTLAGFLLVPAKSDGLGKAEGAKYCKVQRRRAKLLERVVDELNPSHFAAMWQEMHFELGEVASSMVDAKQAVGHRYCSVARCATRAEKHFKRFLDGFRVPMPDGDMPTRIDNEEAEQTYLTGRFTLARLLQKAHRCAARVTRASARASHYTR